MVNDRLHCIVQPFLAVPEHAHGRIERMILTVDWVLPCGGTGQYGPDGYAHGSGEVSDARIHADDEVAGGRSLGRIKPVVEDGMVNFLGQLVAMNEIDPLVLARECVQHRLELGVVHGTLLTRRGAFAGERADADTLGTGPGIVDMLAYQLLGLDVRLVLVVLKRHSELGG